MGFRFRKSINLGGGAKINFNKKSVGLSVGGKGFRYSVNSNGRRSKSVGIPGTGLYYTTSSGGKKRRKANTPAMSNTTNVQHINPVLYTIIVFFFGLFGVHKFIVGSIGMGILYFCTGGLFGIGWIIDLIKAINSIKQQ